MSTKFAPARLQTGDTIVLFAPASTVSAREVFSAQKRWQALGYHVQLASNIGSEDGYFEGDLQSNLDAIHAAVADPKVKALVAVRGGYGCARLLPHLDYALIRNNPKVFLGFSDLTALLNAITAKTGLITYHGPVGKTKLTKTNRHYLQQCLRQQADLILPPKQPLKIHGAQIPRILHPGKVTGELIGGNLAVLSSLLGSNYLPKNWQGKLLFLEDVREDVYRIDRMLMQLQLSGVLDEIAGIVFGQFSHCSAIMRNSFNLEQVLLRYVKPLGVPAISGAMFGHQTTMYTLPIGGVATLDADNLTVTVHALN